MDNGSPVAEAAFISRYINISSNYLSMISRDKLYNFLSALCRSSQTGKEQNNAADGSGGGREIILRGDDMRQPFRR